MAVPETWRALRLLRVAGVPYERWLRFVGPLVLKLLGAAALVLVGAVWFGYA